MERKPKEYYGAPEWFARGFARSFRGAGASLLNVKDSAHYIGVGFDEKKKTWTEGSFLTDFELSLPFWRKEAERSDFIVHFKERRDNSDGE
jgi:hypothetical protein